LAKLDGVLIARANSRNIFWQEIQSETNQNWQRFLINLKATNIKPKSFTINSRKGVIKLIQAIFANIPIQLFHFHQIATITRYTQL